MSLFCESAAASSALADMVRPRPEGTAPNRVVAVAAGRLAAALAALVCIPLLVLHTGGAIGPFGLLTAGLPSILVLGVLNRDDMESALAAAAGALAVLSAGALICGAATIGLSFLALAAAAELVIYGGTRRRRFTLGALLFSALAGAVSPHVGLSASIAPDAAQAAVIVSALVALVHGSVALLFASRRMVVSESAAARASAQMQELLQAMRDVVLSADRSGRVTGIIGSTEAVLGLAAGELRGRGLLDRLHVADRPALLKALAEATLDGRSTQIDLRLRVGEGENTRHLCLETRIAPGAATNDAVLVLHDVTARDEELRQLRAEDGLRLAARRNRGLFISSLSHEVRTPLNAVIGFSEMLANPGLPSLPQNAVQEYAGLIRDSGQQLFRLVMATIDLMRLDSGTYETNPEPLAIADLIEDCIDGVADATDAHDVELMRELPAMLPEIVADRRAIREALTQVLSNAMKFAPAGTMVHVTARSAGGGVMITVTDRGPGIAPEHLAHICDPFFQGDSSYDRSVSGAGLGLALVRRLMDVTGGELRIQSELGQGTVIDLLLPPAPPLPVAGGGTVHSFAARPPVASRSSHDEIKKKIA